MEAIHESYERSGKGESRGVKGKMPGCCEIPPRVMSDAEDRQDVTTAGSGVKG